MDFVLLITDYEALSGQQKKLINKKPWNLWGVVPVTHLLRLAHRKHSGDRGMEDFAAAGNQLVSHDVTTAGSWEANVKRFLIHIPQGFSPSQTCLADKLLPWACQGQQLSGPTRYLHSMSLTRARAPGEAVDDYLIWALPSVVMLWQMQTTLTPAGRIIKCNFDLKNWDWTSRILISYYEMYSSC